MNVLDLFSGIGGFSLGLERAGMRTVAFCEIEKYPRQILAKHWPGVPIYDDIRRLTAARLQEDGIGPIDLICGGFPCQPFSVAGKRKGAADDRDLWPEMFRVIQEVRPAWVLGENVAGIISMELDNIIADLESAEYAVQTFDFSSDSLDLPTMERHVWVVAASASIGLKGGWEKSMEAFENGTKKFSGGYSREPYRRDLSETRVCGVGERVPHRVDRLKCLGNAVPHQFPELFARAIMAVEKGEPNE